MCRNSTIREVRKPKMQVRVRWSTMETLMKRITTRWFKSNMRTRTRKMKFKMVWLLKSSHHPRVPSKKITNRKSYQLQLVPNKTINKKKVHRTRPNLWLKWMWTTNQQ